MMKTSLNSSGDSSNQQQQGSRAQRPQSRSPKPAAAAGGSAGAKTIDKERRSLLDGLIVLERPCLKADDARWKRGSLASATECNVPFLIAPPSGGHPFLPQAQSDTPPLEGATPKPLYDVSGAALDSRFNNFQSYAFPEGSVPESESYKPSAAGVSSVVLRDPFNAVGGGAYLCLMCRVARPASLKSYIARRLGGEEGIAFNSSGDTGSNTSPGGGRGKPTIVTSGQQESTTMVIAILTRFQHSQFLAGYLQFAATYGHLSALEEMVQRQAGGEQELARRFPMGKELSLQSATMFCLMTNQNTVRPNPQLFTFVDAPLSTLLFSFPYDALVLLLSIVLSEGRVLFVGHSFAQASQCVFALCALLYPLRWPHALLPLLPLTMLDVLHQQQERSMQSNSQGSAPFTEPKLQPLLAGTSGEGLPAVLLMPLKGLWIADARTGQVALSSSDETPDITSLPESIKLKDALKKCVPKEDRLRWVARCEALSSPAGSPSVGSPTLANSLSAGVGSARVIAAQQASSVSPALQLETFQVTPPALSTVVQNEVLTAFVDYLIMNLGLGVYRKGVWKDPVTMETGLTPEEFLPKALQAGLAPSQLIRNFCHAVLSLEAIGLNASDHGHLELFYQRCLYRHPDKFPELEKTQTGQSKLAKHGTKKSLVSFMSKARDAVRQQFSNTAAMQQSAGYTVAGGGTVTGSSAAWDGSGVNGNQVVDPVAEHMKKKDQGRYQSLGKGSSNSPSAASSPHRSPGPERRTSVPGYAPILTRESTIKVQRLTMDMIPNFETYHKLLRPRTAGAKSHAEVVGSSNRAVANGETIRSAAGTSPTRPTPRNNRKPSSVNPFMRGESVLMNTEDPQQPAAAHSKQQQALHSAQSSKAGSPQATHPARGPSGSRSTTTSKSLGATLDELFAPVSNVQQQQQGAPQLPPRKPPTSANRSASSPGASSVMVPMVDISKAVPGGTREAAGTTPRVHQQNQTTAQRQQQLNNYIASSQQQQQQQVAPTQQQKPTHQATSSGGAGSTPPPQQNTSPQLCSVHSRSGSLQGIFPPSAAQLSATSTPHAAGLPLGMPTTPGGGSGSEGKPSPQTPTRSPISPSSVEEKAKREAIHRSVLSLDAIIAASSSSPSFPTPKSATEPKSGSVQRPTPNQGASSPGKAEEGVPLRSQMSTSSFTDTHSAGPTPQTTPQASPQANRAAQQQVQLQRKATALSVQHQDSSNGGPPLRRETTLPPGDSIILNSTKETAVPPANKSNATAAMYGRQQFDIDDFFK